MATPFDHPPVTKQRVRRLPSPRRVRGALPTLSLESFDSKYLPMIETALAKQVSRYDNRDVILKSLQGGKRVRARLAMLAYRGCNGAEDGEGVKTAVAAELSHVASLIKDDIMDKDPTRRGSPALWVESGPLETMRTADTMIMTAIDALLESGKNLVGTLIGGWRDSWQGESQDYSIVRGLQQVNGPAYELYLKVVKRKTAALFAMATKLGAQAASASEEQVRALYRYGEDVGIAYQVADDAVDFKRGKFELLPALALAHAELAIKEQVLGALTQGKMNVGEALMGTGINIEQFLRGELRSRLKRIEAEVDRMSFLNEKYRPLFTAFPARAVRSMLAEMKMENFVD